MVAAMWRIISLGLTNPVGHISLIQRNTIRAVTSLPVERLVVGDSGFTATAALKQLSTKIHA
jgi:hypothetical protein